jgi:hypothetical protein
MSTDGSTHEKLDKTIRTTRENQINKNHKGKTIKK